MGNGNVPIPQGATIGDSVPIPEGATIGEQAPPAATAAKPPESHWYTGIGDTLGREIKETGSSIANFPASVVQTWTTPPTKEEESQPYSPYGILKHVGMPHTGLTAQRMVSDPLMEAYRFYAPQAVGGRAEPDIAGRMLSVAPEGMGEGAGNAILFGPGGITSSASSLYGGTGFKPTDGYSKPTPNSPLSGGRELSGLNGDNPAPNYGGAELKPTLTDIHNPFTGKVMIDPVAVTQATVRNATRGLNYMAPGITGAIGGEIAGRVLGLPHGVVGGAAGLISEFAPKFKNFRPLPRAMEQWGLSPEGKLFQGTQMFKPEVGKPILVTAETKAGLEKGTIKGADLKSVEIGGKTLWVNASNEPRLQAYINTNGTPWNVPKGNAPTGQVNIPGTDTPATPENWAAMDKTMTGMMKGTPTPYGPQNVAPPISPESPVAPKIAEVTRKDINQKFGPTIDETFGVKPEPPKAPVAIPEGHTPITSSSGLTSFKAMPETGEIEVMKGDKGYRYAVDPEDIKAFNEAKSKGVAWNQLQKKAGDPTWKFFDGKWHPTKR